MSTKTALAPFETKAKNTRERTFEGLASPFGTVDFGGDTIIPGAYTKTLAEWRSSGRSLPLVDSHDYSSVVRTRLGKMIDARETDGGLWVKFKVFRTRAGDDLIAMLEDEGVDGLSIGYTVDDYEMTTLNGKSVRALEAISLREISAVHWGMAYEAHIDHDSLKHRTYTDPTTGRKTDAFGWPISASTAPFGCVAAGDPSRIRLESELRELEFRQLAASL